MADWLHGQEIIGGTTILRMNTLWLMGLVIRQSSKLVLILSTTEYPPEGGEDAEEESDNKSDS